MGRASRKRTSKGVTTSSNGSSAAYTAEQREQLRRGLRILARMIVRAHLRWSPLIQTLLIHHVLGLYLGMPFIVRQAHYERFTRHPLSEVCQAGEVLRAQRDGDARVTRYESLANPMCFLRLDGRPAEQQPSSKPTRGRNKSEAMAGNAFSVLFEHIGHYHKFHPDTTSGKTLYASNLPFKMRWTDVSKLRHPIGSHEFTNTSIERRNAGRSGPR